MASAPIIILAVCAVATALIILVGNPLLWIASDRVAVTGERVQQPAEGAVVLGEGHTASLSLDENRMTNLSVAAQTLDGLTIMPGEILSVNEILGDTGRNPSYMEAPAFSGGAVAAERGGGVCQVASALYIAALKSNLEIVERYPHTIGCDYAPLGLDATLAYGSKDLKIRNDGDSPVYVSVKAEGQAVDVSFSGPERDDGVTYDAQSKAVAMRTVPIKDAVTELGLDSLPDGSNGSEMVVLYDVESYKTWMDRGSVSKTELISTDTYLIAGETAGVR